MLKQSMALFIQTQKQKQSSMKVTFVIYLNQSILYSITNIQKYLGKDSGWIIDLVVEHNISISKYNPLAGSSYIKLPKELDHLRKRLINIQSIDDNYPFFLYRTITRLTSLYQTVT